MRRFITFALVAAGLLVAVGGDCAAQAKIKYMPKRKRMEKSSSTSEQSASQILIQMLIVEVRGNVEQALQEVGIAHGAPLQRRADDAADSSASDLLSARLRLLARHAEVDVLSRPQ